MNKYNIPDDIEEAKKLQEEVFNKINNYNEQLLTDGTPSISDEEYQELQDVYEMLESKLGLSLTEEIEKKHEMEHEKEEAKKPKKLEWLNRINHFYYLSGIIAMLFTNFWFLVFMGIKIINKFIENDKITSITEKADVWKLVGINTIYPLIILAVMSLIWLTFIGNHKNKKENKRLYLIVYIIFVVYLIAMTVLSNVYLYKSFIGMVS